MQNVCLPEESGVGLRSWFDVLSWPKFSKSNVEWIKVRRMYGLRAKCGLSDRGVRHAWDFWEKSVYVITYLLHGAESFLRS